MMWFILVLELVAVFLAMYAGYNCQLVTDGVIWGIPVPPSKAQKKFKTVNRILLVLGLALFIILTVPAFKAVISLLFQSFLIAVIYAVIWGLDFLAAARIAQKQAMKNLYSGKETNTFVLSDLPFVQKVESEMEECVSFVVSFEGIALVNKMNYCYAVERYEDFQMGSLTSPKEVALIGMYFVQKYHEQFNFKVDMETIPGTPGQMVTAFGTGGFNVAYVKGTRDKKIFRSYIFTRK